MRALVIAIAIAVQLATPSLDAQDFAKAMKQVFGKQFKDYQWLDYPLDNFGVATAYRDAREATNPRNFLCATFSCLGIDPVPTANDDSTTNRQWLAVSRAPGTPGYADFGCGAALNAELSRHSRTAIRAFLPKIFSLLGLTADLKAENSFGATVVLSRACNRLLNGRIEGFIANLSADDFGIRRAALAGELILIKGDVVINAFEVSLPSTSSLRAQLDGKLEGKARATFGDSSRFGVEVSRDQRGDYRLRTTSPLIVGVLAVRQPVELGLTASTLKIDPQRWKKIRIALPDASGAPR